jgi:hypothetical protein
MTAVNLTKLNQEIYELLAFYTRPSEFHENLRSLFEYYSVQVYQRGVGVKSNARLKEYHIPVLVLMQCERLIHKRCIENPQAALRLYDELIQDAYVEVNQFSASILGSLPPVVTLDVLQRIDEQGKIWERDERLVEYLHRSTRSVIPNSPDKWLEYLDKTLPGTIEHYHRFGLQLLTTCLQNDSFENIPFFFRHFLMFLPKANLRFQPEYVYLFQELYNKYPTESVHFFEQALSMVQHDAFFRVFRRFLPSLAEPEKSRLRELAKG